MNPKEVSYSHPQLPLCDTPIFEKSSRLPDLRRKSTAFLEKRKESRKNFMENPASAT